MYIRTIDQSQPQLIVILFLHGRHHLTAMLQDVRLFEAGHEMRLNHFPAFVEKFINDSIHFENSLFCSCSNRTYLLDERINSSSGNLLK